MSLICKDCKKTLEYGHKCKLNVLAQPKDISSSWRDVVGYEGLYEVSDTGLVRSVKGGRRSGKILKHGLHPLGYYGVSLCKDGKAKTHTVHRLVAMAFIPNPDNKQTINHIDGVKNNNKVENLEWNTMQENALHKYRVLKKKPWNIGIRNSIKLYTCPKCGAEFSDKKVNNRIYCSNKCADASGRIWKRKRITDLENQLKGDRDE